MPSPVSFTVEYEIFGVTIADTDALLGPTGIANGAGTAMVNGSSFLVEPSTVGRTGQKIAVAYFFESFEGGAIQITYVSSDNAENLAGNLGITSRVILGPTASPTQGEIILTAHKAWKLNVEGIGGGGSKINNVVVNVTLVD